MLLFAKAGLGSPLLCVAAPLEAPQWNVQVRGDHAEIRIVWSAEVSVIERRREQELTLTFSAPLQDVPAAKLMAELGVFLRNVEYGYDMLLLEFTGEMHVEVLRLPTGVSVSLRKNSASNQNSVSTPQEGDPVQEHRRVALLRAIAWLEAGEVTRARTALESLWRRHPDDVNVAMSLARAQEQGGAWCDAMKTASLALAGHPENAGLALSLDRLRSVYGDHADLRVVLRNGENGEHQRGLGVKGRTLFGERGYLAWDLEHREMEYGEFIHADGTESAFSGGRGSIAAGAGYQWADQNLFVGLDSNTRVLGWKGKYEVGGPALSYALSAEIDTPYTDYVEARIQDATRRGIDLSAQTQRAGHWAAAASFGWRRYGLADIGHVADSARGAGSVSWNIRNAPLAMVLRYGLDVERFRNVERRGTENVAALPVRSRNVHAVSIELQKSLSSTWRIGAGLGYAYSEQGEHGPFTQVQIARVDGRKRTWKAEANRASDWKREGAAAVTDAGVTLSLY